MTGPDQSRFQRWALSYHHYAEKRDRSDEFFELKKLLHLILRGTDDKLYAAAFPSVEVEDPDVIPGHTYGVDDLEDIERMLQKLDVIGHKTQAQLDPSEWSDWG